MKLSKKAGGWRSYKATCPYYNYESRRHIACLGTTSDNRIHITFTGDAAKALHKCAKCNYDYESCEIYKMIHKQ